MASLWSPPGPRGLWNYVRQYPRRYADQFNQGMQQFARTRNPVAALGALNPTTPFIQDAALQAGGLIAPQANQLNQAVSQASENLGLGPLSIPEVTDEQLAPFLMLGMGSPSKMGFFSPSGKALTTAPGKGTSQQYLAHLKKEPGATKEAKETGLIQRLEEAPGTLTKEEVVSMWNPIELTETVRGEGFIDPKYGNEANLNLPGGEEPKEILVQLPEREKSPYELTHKASGEVRGVFPNRDAAFEALQEYSQRGEGTQYQIGPQRSSPDYKSTHWSEPNVLAHIRTNKRDVGGVRALHAEEFQSDWHQQGQKKGYVDADQKRVLENRLTQIQEAIRASNQQIAGDDNAGLLKKLDGDTSGLNVMIWDHPEGGTNFADRNQNVNNDYASIGTIDRNGNLSTTKYTTPEQKILLEKQAELVRERNSIRNDLRPMSLSSGKVPDAPYKKDWHELAFKRFLMEGVNDPSVDRITWTSGDVQTDRYDLSKQVDAIQAHRNPDGTYYIRFDSSGGQLEDVATTVPSEKLPEIVGKELADKIIAEVKTEDRKKFSGVDLQVGGEFHKQLYDKKIPQFAKKFLKKYGVEPQRISEDGETIDEYEIIVDEGNHDLWRGEEFVRSFETRKEAENYLKDFENLWYIDITPEMRRDLQQKGVPLAMNNRRPKLGLLA